MCKAGRRRLVLVNGKKIFSFFFGKLNFKIIVNPEIKTKYLIQLPAQLVIFNRRYNAQQYGVFKKLPGYCFIVYFKFHIWRLKKNFILIFFSFCLYLKNNIKYQFLITSFYFYFGGISLVKFIECFHISLQVGKFIIT